MKNPPAMQETWVRSPYQGDSPGGGHGNPLQYSCLENARVGGAWWATVQRVTEELNMPERLNNTTTGNKKL